MTDVEVIEEVQVKLRNCFRRRSSSCPTKRTCPKYIYKYMYLRRDPQNEDALLLIQLVEIDGKADAPALERASRGRIQKGIKKVVRTVSQTVSRLSRSKSSAIRKLKFLIGKEDCSEADRQPTGPDDHQMDGHADGSNAGKISEAEQQMTKADEDALPDHENSNMAIFRRQAEPETEQGVFGCSQISLFADCNQRHILLTEDMMQILPGSSFIEERHPMAACLENVKSLETPSAEASQGNPSFDELQQLNAIFHQAQGRRKDTVNQNYTEHQDHDAMGVQLESSRSGKENPDEGYGGVVYVIIYTTVCDIKEDDRNYGTHAEQNNGSSADHVDEITSANDTINTLTETHGKVPADDLDHHTNTEEHGTYALCEGEHGKSSRSSRGEKTRRGDNGDQMTAAEDHKQITLTGKEEAKELVEEQVKITPEYRDQKMAGEDVEASSTEVANDLALDDNHETKVSDQDHAKEAAEKGNHMEPSAAVSVGAQAKAAEHNSPTQNDINKARTEDTEIQDSSEDSATKYELTKGHLDDATSGKDVDQTLPTENTNDEAHHDDVQITLSNDLTAACPEQTSSEVCEDQPKPDDLKSQTPPEAEPDGAPADLKRQNGWSDMDPHQNQTDQVTDKGHQKTNRNEDGGNQIQATGQALPNTAEKESAMGPLDQESAEGGSAALKFTEQRDQITSAEANTIKEQNRRRAFPRAEILLRSVLLIIHILQLIPIICELHPEGAIHLSRLVLEIPALQTSAHLIEVLVCHIQASRRQSEETRFSFAYLTSLLNVFRIFSSVTSIVHTSQHQQQQQQRQQQRQQQQQQQQKGWMGREVHSGCGGQIFNGNSSCDTRNARQLRQPADGQLSVLDRILETNFKTMMAMMETAIRHQTLQRPDSGGEPCSGQNNDNDSTTTDDNSETSESTPDASSQADEQGRRRDSDYPVQCEEDTLTRGETPTAEPPADTTTMANLLPARLGVKPHCQLVVEPMDRLEDFDISLLQYLEPGDAAATISAAIYEAEAENRRLRAGFSCHYCIDQPAERVLIPCGHLLCLVCLDVMGQVCLVNGCHSRIQDSHAVYIP